MHDDENEIKKIVDENLATFLIKHFGNQHIQIEDKKKKTTKMKRLDMHAFEMKCRKRIFRKWIGNKLQ